MKRRFQNWHEKFEKWMSERHGVDELSVFLLRVSMIGLLVSFLCFNTPFFKGLCIAMLVPALWGFGRSLTKDTLTRQDELKAYQAAKRQITYKASMRWQARKLHRAYRYYQCKSCGAKIRVSKKPKTSDLICPDCGNSNQKAFRRRSYRWHRK